MPFKVLTCGDRRKTPPFITVGFASLGALEVTADTIFVGTAELHPSACGAGSPVPGDNTGIVGARLATPTPRTAPSSTAPTQPATVAPTQPRTGLVADPADASPPRGHTDLVLLAAAAALAIATVGLRTVTLRRRRRAGVDASDTTNGSSGL